MTLRRISVPCMRSALASSNRPNSGTRAAARAELLDAAHHVQLDHVLARYLHPASATAARSVIVTVRDTGTAAALDRPVVHRYRLSPCPRDDTRRPDGGL